MPKSLAELRAINKLTQKDMAEKLGIAISTYNMYETGKRNIPIKIAIQISNILNIDKDKIFLPATFTLSENQHYKYKKFDEK